MKVAAVLQTYLVARALAQHTASEHFNRICFSLDGQTEQIVPGYTVRYKCDAYGPHDGNKIPASTPRDCAILCESTRECKGSTWLSDQRQCVLNGEQPSGIRQKTIYMKKEEVDLFPEGEDPFSIDAADAIKQCQKNQKDCENQLDQCNDRRLQDNQQSALQLAQIKAQHLEENQNLALQLDQCIAQRVEDEKNYAAELEKLRDPLVISGPVRCPEHHGKKVSVGGTIFQNWCGAYHNHGAWLGDAHNVGEIHDCMALCVARDGCDQALVSHSGKYCRLYSSKNKSGGPPPHKSAGWNGGIKV